MKEEVYSFHEGIGSERYFNWDVLYNKQGNGIMQKLEPVEKEIFKRTNDIKERWYQKGKINSKELKALYGSLSDYVTQSYQQLFGL